MEFQLTWPEFFFMRESDRNLGGLCFWVKQYGVEATVEESITKGKFDHASATLLGFS